MRIEEHPILTFPEKKTVKFRRYATKMYTDSNKNAQISISKSMVALKALRKHSSIYNMLMA